MVFSSITFLCFFFPVVVIGYHIVFRKNIKLQNAYLLLMSLVFYAFGSLEYLLVFAAVIFVSYCSAILISRCSASAKCRKFRLPLLIVSLIVCFSVLIYFKYFPFIIKNIERLFSCKINFAEVALPIGISFYTFQSTSYIIDVFRNEKQREQDPAVEQICQHNICNLALYISFFPQLIAGPIVRYTDIHHELYSRTHSVEGIAIGLERFSVGLAKKAILANILGQTATRIMVTDCGSIGAATAWLGSICYTLQIYFDFSGYSDMAIGMGRIFGFTFPENFNYPYIADSIAEFWRRWHITLSSWFRDYVYFPLGGSRKNSTYINIAIVFLLTGIWHGAAWAFVLWGMWHGAFRLLELFLSRRHLKCAKYRWLKPFKWLYMILVVNFGWIPFRLGIISQSFQYIEIMLGLKTPDFVGFTTGYYMDARLIFVLITGIICCLPWRKILSEKLPTVFELFETTAGIVMRRIVLLVLVIICYTLVLNGSYNPFIYFRF